LSSCESSEGFGVVLFHSAQGAIGAEKVLVDAAVEHKLIAVPRSLSPNCGFCLRFAWTDRDLVDKLLSDAKLGVERIAAL
jgi:hypothetical protein